jgi:glycosyltransferase involved in cell wall biosynthesis
MKISVIMPSYLGNYNGAASNREYKFERAVNSFLNQEYQDKELIIVSDGCEITKDIVNKKYNNELIKLIKIDKQVLFSGYVRDVGLKIAKGDIITYLDTDDYFGNNLHLYFIYKGFLNPDIDWVYFDDIMRWNNFVYSQREAVLQSGRIGTSNIAHRNIKNISWENLDGYGHDWYFINKLIEKYKYQKIGGTSYTVCHIPNVADV